jgi:hypothetical protein
MDEWQSDAPVRPESCDGSQQSEPVAFLFGGGVLGECFALSGLGIFFVGTRGDAPVYHIAPL